MAGTITVSGMSASESAGYRVIGPISYQGTVVIGETLAVNLIEGDNQFAIPKAAVAALIVPPTNNTVGLTLRTDLNPNDVGLPIFAGAAPLVYPWPLSPAPGFLIFTAANPIVNATLTIAFI